VIGTPRALIFGSLVSDDGAPGSLRTKYRTVDFSFASLRRQVTPELLSCIHLGPSFSLAREMKYGEGNTVTKPKKST